jgi:hypothetical protein
MRLKSCKHSHGVLAAGPYTDVMKKDMLQVSHMVSLKVIEKVFLTGVAPSTKS